MEQIHQSIRDRWQRVRTHPEDTAAAQDLRGWVKNMNPKIRDRYLPPEMRNDPEFVAWHEEHC